MKPTAKINIQLEKAINIDSSGFVCCSGKNYHSFLNNSQGLKVLGETINELGILSAKSQNLKQIITSLTKFAGSDQRIYIKFQDNKGIGFLKIGEKSLFYRDYMSNFKQIHPTCVLDFYVHESYQRSGIGKEIFQKFLSMQGKEPRKLAYDRPSSKLLNFLKKYYNLSKHVPQNNNFVIYDQFFIQPIYQSEKKLSEDVNAQKQQKKQPQLIDSLELLEKEGYKMMKNNPWTQKEKIANEVGFRSPWAIKDEKIMFGTTANTYGSHYRFPH